MGELTIEQLRVVFFELVNSFLNSSEERFRTNIACEEVCVVILSEIIQVQPLQEII